MIDLDQKNLVRPAARRHSGKSWRWEVSDVQALRRKATTLTAVALLLGPASATAQTDSGYKVSLGIGVGQFDMRGTSQALVANGRIDRPVFNRRGVLEFNIGHAAVPEQFTGTQTQLLFYEVQLQAQIPGRTFAPYIGAGPGGVAFLTNAGDRQRVSGAFSGSGGIRVRLTSRISLRPEVRLRFWGASPDGSVFSDNAVEYTIAVRF